jgi:hypothetical protein
MSVSSLLLFNFTLKYAIRIIQENEEGLEMNGTHLQLVGFHNANLLDEIISTTKKNTETLLVVGRGG